MDAYRVSVEGQTLVMEPAYVNSGLVWWRSAWLRWIAFLTSYSALDL